MKNISITLLVIILASSLVQGDGTTYTCSTHPIFLMAQDFLINVVDGDTNGAEIIQKVIDAYAANTPAALTASDLGFCSQFAGEKTCCTKKMIEVFDVAAIYSVSDIQMNGTGVNNLLYVIQKVLDANQCGSSASSMTNEEFLANSALTNLQAYYNAGQTAKVQFSKVIAGLNRGALCSVCAGVDMIASYYVSPNLQLDSANNIAFTSALDDSFDGLDAAINNATLLDAAIDELLTTYIGDCSSYTATIKADIQRIYGTKNADKIDSDSAKKCSGKAIFTERSVCDAAQDGDPQVETDADDYTPAQNNARLLADTEDSVIAKSGGLKVFITNNSDDEITADGDFAISWPTSIIDDSTNNGNNNNNYSISTTTSVSRISFVAITLLCIVFIL